MKKNLVTLKVRCISSDENTWIAYKISQAVLNKQKTLPVIIDSPGGEVYALFGLVDMLKNSGLDIVTIAIGKAMSCGAVLFSLGSKRYQSENATIMLHKVSSGTMGTVSEMSSNINELQRLNDKAFKMLDDNCGKKLGHFSEMVKDNTNIYLDSEMSIQHNLATDIGIPTIADLFTPDEITNIGFNPYDDEEDTASMKILMCAESFTQNDSKSLDQKIIKEEETPKMSGQILPSGKSNETVTMVEMKSLLDNQKETFEAQMKAFDKKVDERMVLVKEQTEKEVEMRYKEKFDNLNAQLGSMSADMIINKKEKEKIEVKAFLKDLQQNQNKITKAESDEMEVFMIAHTSLENGSRQAYMKSLELRPQLLSINQELPDNKDISFSLSKYDRELLAINPQMKSEIMENAKRKHVAEKNNLSIYDRKDKAKIDQLVKQLG